jgi:hypothetical protein
MRTYDSAEAASFLADLLDGYFPYEMRYAFPDGSQYSYLAVCSHWL